MPHRNFPLVTLVFFLLSTSCAHLPSGPEAVAEAYARALEEGRLEEAYALTGGTREEQAAWEQRYASAEARRARAAEVRAGLTGLSAKGRGLELTTQPGKGWRVVEARPEELPRAALKRFLEGVEAGEWAVAWGLLSASWRGQYTPERLKEDFGREPLASERLKRAKLALGGPVRLEGLEALFPVGEDGAVRLVLEEGEYRVAALE